MYKVVLTRDIITGDYRDYLFNSEEVSFPNYLVNKYSEILDCKHIEVDLIGKRSTLELTFDSEQYFTLWLLKQ